MLSRDQVQALNALRDAERYQTLATKDYVTKSQADQARATADALRASVQSDSAALENAKLNLAYCTIKAPISGRTGSLLVRQGNLVKQGGGPLVLINQIHPILVRFPVTQRDFLALSQRAASGGVPVSVVTADSIPVAESGTLSFLDNAVDSLTGTVSAKAEFANGARKLWPGEYVRVSVQLEVLPNVLAVPAPAVQSGQNGPYVFVIDNGQQARMRPVTVGRSVGELTVITAGIEAGERVVIDGQSRLVPGAKVDIQPQQQPQAAREGAPAAVAGKTRK
jgi:multidrug efflux system membrane fusion protein